MLVLAVQVYRQVKSVDAEKNASESGKNLAQRGLETLKKRDTAKEETTDEIRRGRASSRLCLGFFFLLRGDYRWTLRA